MSTEKDTMRELDYGITIAVQGFIEALGMISENLQRIQRHESIAYPMDSFISVIEKHGIHHNAVLSRWANHY